MGRVLLDVTTKDPLVKFGLTGLIGDHNAAIGHAARKPVFGF